MPRGIIKNYDPQQDIQLDCDITPITRKRPTGAVWGRMNFAASQIHLDKSAKKHWVRTDENTSPWTHSYGSEYYFWLPKPLESDLGYVFHPSIKPKDPHAQTIGVTRIDLSFSSYHIHQPYVRKPYVRSNYGYYNRNMPQPASNEKVILSKPHCCMEMPLIVVAEKQPEVFVSSVHTLSKGLSVSMPDFQAKYTPRRGPNANHINWRGWGMDELKIGGLLLYGHATRYVLWQDMAGNNRGWEQFSGIMDLNSLEPRYACSSETTYALGNPETISQEELSKHTRLKSFDTIPIKQMEKLLGKAFLAGSSLSL